MIMHFSREFATLIRRDDNGGNNAAYEEQALNPGLNTWGNDPMVDPRVPFPLYMLLAGMILVAAFGLATQGRHNR